MKIYRITFYNSNGETRHCILKAEDELKAIESAVTTYDAHGIESIEPSGLDSFPWFKACQEAKEKKHEAMCALHQMAYDTTKKISEMKTKIAKI